MKVDTWMPMYPGDWLRDTMHLSRDEQGGYFLLALAYWVRGGALPDDDKHLANVVKASPKEWRELKPVLSGFFLVKDGVWWHKRIETEMLKSSELSRVRKEASAAGNAKQAAKRRQTDPQTDPQTESQTDSQTGSVTGPPSPSPSPSPSYSPTPPRPSSPPAAGGGAGGGDFGGGFVPDDAEVFAFGDAFAGELQPIPTPGPMDRAFVATWLAKMQGRREFPPRWKAVLKAEWRALHSQPGGVGPAKKTGVSESVAAVQREREMTGLRRELRDAEEAADAEGQSGADEGSWQRAEELRKKIAALEAAA